MIDKRVEYSLKKDSSQPMEEEEAQVSNFKHLCRNTSDPERDKSYGVSSDEETTSSSLIPIPESLRLVRNELKKTVSDIGEPSEVESSYTVCSVVEKSAGKFRNSLDKLRQMYTLKNEASVTLKMNSANLMLDDILNSNNLKMKPSESFPPKCFTEEERGTKSSRESTTSTADGSNRCGHLTPILGHSRPPIKCDVLPHVCSMHSNAFRPLCSCSGPLEADNRVQDRNPDESQRKKSLAERIKSLQLKYRIHSVYRMMQKSNPFGKDRKESECVKARQGIPSVGCRDPAEESGVCRCEFVNLPGNHYQKRMTFDLVESSESHQTEDKSRRSEERQCTCSDHGCTCPEAVCNCVCAEYTCGVLGDSDRSNPRSYRSQCLHGPQNVEGTKPDARVDGLSVPQKSEDPPLSSNPLGDKNHMKPERDQDKKELQGKSRKCRDRELIERTDIYYFDHGNSAYYQTTDSHPLRYTECLVERTDEYATKFWQEIFGSVGIGMAFVISFVIQLYRFLFTSLIRPLTVGLLQIFFDYFFKPLLTIAFNGIIQPCLILAYNVATSFRDLCLPISQIFGFFSRELANICRSCRLLEINKGRQTSCNCGNKV